MTRSVAEYLQDWNDACAYARECGPDWSFLDPGEPFNGLGIIAVLCYAAWRYNERRIQRAINRRKGLSVD